jgi:phage protein D
MPTSAPASGAVRSARPTIAVDGKTLASLADGLLSMRISETVDGLFHCELSIGNWGPSGGGGGVDFLYFDRKTLDFGKSLEIGFAGEAVFRGRVTGLEADFPEGAPPVITVLAEDRLQDLRMTRRTRTFDNASDADVFKRIAGEHGLSTDIQLDGPTHRVLAQLNQSDLAFMRERARSLDAELWVNDRKLLTRAHGDRNAGSIDLAYGNGLREFVALADLAHQRTAVDVTGWDVAGKSALKERADASLLGAELKGGVSGPSVLSSALGDRREVVVDAVPTTSSEARARAQALLKRRARRFLTGHGIAEPNPGIRVGAYAKLSGLGALFTGEYYIVSTRHVFDGLSGMRTEFRAERPGMGKQ